MRADARRNRERLLDAATELVLEVGGPPNRDAVAERAGVGIGTLYRHFPDPTSLLEAIVERALERTVSAAEAALATSPDGASALRTYAHAAVDHGLGAVHLVHAHVERPHPELRARADAAITAILERGRADGGLRTDVSAADIVFATIRFCRPLAVGLPLAEERAIAHRHVDTWMDGMKP
ncbi:MAG: TetR/AcrR family transcriptional regulator [Alphaproteobacteria bacterium]|nr:TetR/AcrR family transcriptional regulator [Alphaproteobacteria bacterium]